MTCSETPHLPAFLVLPPRWRQDKERGSKHLIRIKISTVLPDIHTDLVCWSCHICRERSDDFTGWPYVIEHKDWDCREAKDSKPGYPQNIGEENKLQKGETDKYLTHNSCFAVNPSQTGGTGLGVDGCYWQQSKKLALFLHLFLSYVVTDHRNTDLHFNRFKNPEQTAWLAEQH